jgi:hypothetical protein
MDRRVRSQAKTKGGRVTPTVIDDTKNKYAVFSFERVEPGDFCFSQLTSEEKAELADSIFRRRQLTWVDIRAIPHDKLGTEAISIEQFSPTMPQFVTQDTNSLVVFRFGSNGRIAGLRRDRLFYILFVDTKYKLYKH